MGQILLGTNSEPTKVQAVLQEICPFHISVKAKILHVWKKCQGDFYLHKKNLSQLSGVTH
jgi:hypothetical protein